jgi:aspartate 4-decarboxylase
MRSKWDKYKYMSPFEIKNELVETAAHFCEINKKKGRKGYVLNVGRGNPDFLNIPVRHAFAYLNLFVTNLAAEDLHTTAIGLRPKKEGIAKRFEEFIKKNKGKEGIAFLKKAILFAIKKFKMDPDEFVFCLSDAALGDYYPVPPRIFTPFEKILRVYLNDILGLKENPKSENFDLFATEGGSAAMVYIFKSLKINKLIRPGDTIAIITPIFSPYLEIPQLNDYNLKEIFIKSDENLDWQIPLSELEKLADHKIKALYLVNPANPTSVAINDAVIKELTHFVKKRRPDLIIITDTVYATFVENFHSVIKNLSHNTICVYSFSKYFGVTGWRLGLVMMHKKNIIDGKIRSLPKKDKLELESRYRMVSTSPSELPFIERLELDSRDAALAHTGGLSGPQQSIMTLFALFDLMDEKKDYKKRVHDKLKARINDFYKSLGVPVPEEKGNTYYYSLIDFREVAKYKYGKEFANYLEKKVNPMEFLFRLAKEKFTVLLPGKGFAAPDWSLRVSLANLSDKSYTLVGKNISEILHSVYEKWNRKK